LPTASNTTKGGIKIGSNLSIDKDVLSLSKSNVTNALGYTPPTTNTTYSAATQSANGLMSAADKIKLDGIATGAQVNTVTGVKGNSESTYRTGNVNITKANIGLGNVDNTADSAKSVKYATSAGSVSKSLTVGTQTYNGSAAVTITAADLGLSSAFKYCGVTTTTLTDGATTNPITINDADHTATNGCTVGYNNSLFVWTGSAWEELGNPGNYKVTQSAVSDPTASGTSKTFIATIS
jgi:hypothetical protein